MAANLATRLAFAQAAPSRQVADVLLAQADQSSTYDLGANPTDEALAGLGKTAGWQSYTTIARSTTCPTQLASLARRPALGVRRAVALNRHIDTDTAQYLFEYGMDRGDVDISGGACLGLDATWLIDYLEALEFCPVNLQWPNLAMALVASNDVDVITRALRFGNSSKLVGAVATAVASSPTCLVRVGDLATLAGDNAGDALHAATTDLEIWDVEHAVAFVAATELIKSSNANADGGRAHPFKAAKQLTIEAAELLVRTGDPMWVQVAIHGIDLPGHLIDEALAAEEPSRASKTVSSALLDHPTKLSAAQADLAASWAAPSPGLVRFGPSGLSTATRLKALRNGDLHETWSFILSKIGDGPRDGELSALIENTGMAFRASGGSRHEVSAKQDIAQLLFRNGAQLAATAVLLNSPFIGEVVEALGPAFVYLAATSQMDSVTGIDRYVAKRFNERLGEDAGLWSVALSLVPNWERSLEALLDTALLLGS